MIKIDTNESTIEYHAIEDGEKYKLKITNTETNEEKFLSRSISVEELNELVKTIILDDNTFDKAISSIEEKLKKNKSIKSLLEELKN